jgi:biopolymer transport protein ExbD/biopolymer transport protein TolR
MAMEVGTTGGKPGRATPSMNVTPLVDVVLVLLIIFMVITPMLAKQFWVHLPNKPEVEEEPTPPDSDNQPIVVSVNVAGDIKINRDVVPKAQFENKLRRVLAGSGQRTVFFDADEETEFGKAAEAMDLARGGGAATIVLLTEALSKD